MRATNTAGAGSTAAGGGTVFSGFGGAAATATGSSSGGNTLGATAMLANLGHSYGVFVVAAGILTGFAML